MRVGLFIPCYIDIFKPKVALATYKILKKLKCDVIYPPNQSCCAQPLINSGDFEDAKELANKFIDTFESFDYIVAPSASCIATVKYRYPQLNIPRADEIAKKSFEICEFLTDILKVTPKDIDISFPYRVGFHQSCHGLRELNLATPSELNLPFYSKPLKLLNMVKDIELVPLDRADECCGFGGVFSIMEPEISVIMGRDRINDHIKNKAQYIVGYDSSCLMHMESIAKKEKKDIKFLHIVQILAGEWDES
ncbi:MAG: (Fe-S)-binding protein [Epsilonproteobacteria bacterium]|nr:(Fe-S)-binding protein [Campylobacterota bacterium]